MKPEGDEASLRCSLGLLAADGLVEAMALQMMDERMWCADDQIRQI